MKINFVLSVLITFTVCPMAHAVSPAPDGGYPSGNTAEGQKAPFSLTTGTPNTARRFKHDIKPMDKASAVIFALKPVGFRYNKEYDATQRLSFGLIAEEVAQVGPALVGRNRKGEPEAVRYEQINAMLLNEFLKERKKVQQLETVFAQQRNDFEATIAELKKEIAGVDARSKN